MVALFSTAVIAITVGVYMCIRSDCFMRVPPSNDCIKTTSGTSGGVKQSSREDLEYFNYNENIHRNKNVYVLSKWGIVLTVTGILFLVIYYAILFLAGLSS